MAADIIELKARAETAESALAEARAEIKALEAGIEQEIAARDFAQDCLQQAHIRLGGDGEWTAKPGQIVQPPNTGDLHYDVPALAADVLERAVVAESALEAAQVKVAGLRVACDMAAKKFRTYEYLHTEKGTADGLSKARANALAAEICEEALIKSGVVVVEKG